MTVLSMEARDVGQATVFPHSLKLATSIAQTLPMASWLSTTDLSMAGSKAGGGSAEDWGFFFPFFVRLGAMATERTERRSDWKKELFRGGERVGGARRQR